MKTVVLDYESPKTEAQVKEDRFRVGTLKYTVAGLTWLFAWLLWGDFCFTLMEYVNLQVMPLYLTDLKASDFIFPVIITAIPQTINFILNPIISTKSDRYRSKWGRRRPFLLVSVPFLSGTLVLMAFSKEISSWLHVKYGAIGGWEAGAVAVFTVGVIFASFKVCDMFVNTTFWYFFNDVVPQAFMSRFMGLFRVVASLVAMLFNKYMYANSVENLRTIYLMAAGVYLVGFTLMCLMVKEGEYPPPEAIKKYTKNFLLRSYEALKVYRRECLSDRVYIYFFLHGMFFGLSNAIATFQLKLNLSLGITREDLGGINTAIQFVILVLGYPAGALADRFHPIRVMVWMKMCLLIIVPMQFIWMMGKFSPGQAYYILIALTAIDFPISLLYGAVGMPLMMRLLPRDRFGQFCSFNALCGATINIFAGFVVGGFMTYMRVLFPDNKYGVDYCYRLMPAWRLPCLCVSLLFLWLLYREWKKLGGEKRYSPPGFEQKEVVPTEGEKVAV